MTFLVISIGMESFDPAVHPHACKLSQIPPSVTSLPHALHQGHHRCNSTDFHAIRPQQILPTDILFFFFF